jgi:Tol biopolymer transport system component/DNA-binding winged helix-turn-helix (wHTH) protein
MQPNLVPIIFRFGKFEANLITKELRKQGILIKLQEQPFKVLAILLENAGRIVTREELRERLWLGNTYVNFDHGVNKAISKIREALCDTAENPRFVETLSRRGYRFVAPVEKVGADSGFLKIAESTDQIGFDDNKLNVGATETDVVERESAPVDSELEPVAPKGFQKWREKKYLIGGAALLVVLIILISSYLSTRNNGVVREPMRIVPFTSLPGIEAQPRFSPDGRYVVFQWDGPNRDNLDIYIKQIGVEGQLRLTSDPADDFAPVWSPDGKQIAFERTIGETTSIYSISSLGGTEYKLYDFKPPSGASSLSWSPDGHSLAFSEKSGVEDPSRIVLLSLDTRQKAPLTSPPPGPYGDSNPEFSPDGKQVVFKQQTEWAACDLWIQPVSSGVAVRLTTQHYGNISKPSWTADGREVVYSAGLDSGHLYRVPLGGGPPQAVAGIGENVWNTTIMGSRMVYSQYAYPLNKIWRMRGPRYKGKNRDSSQILVSTRSEVNPNYSTDCKKIAFASTRSGSMEIWTSDSDGTNPSQLTHLGRFSGTPCWSPDGKRIAFDGIPEDDTEIYVINSTGGVPERLTHEKSQDQTPCWSRDGKWIYFSSNRSGTFQIWKIPSEGGNAIQVTKGGGFYAIDSFDGKMLYYLKPGRQYFGVGQIWKVPSEGGTESQVLDQEVFWGNLTIGPEGLYFAISNGKNYTVKSFNFKTGKVSLVFQEKIHRRRIYLNLSPDSEWFLYNNYEEDPGEADLMMVENFR